MIGQQVVEVVCDAAGELSPRFQLARLLQLFLEVCALFDVADDPGEVHGAVHDEPRDRQLHPEAAPVLPDADRAARAGVLVVAGHRQERPTRSRRGAGIGRRHQALDALPEHLGFVVTEHLDGGAVEGAHEAGGVDAGDRLGRVVEDGPREGLGAMPARAGRGR